MSRKGGRRKAKLKRQLRRVISGELDNPLLPHHAGFTSLSDQLNHYKTGMHRHHKRI